MVPTACTVAGIANILIETTSRTVKLNLLGVRLPFMSVPPSLGKCEDSTFDRDGKENNFFFSEVSFIVGGECLNSLVVRSLDHDSLSTSSFHQQNCLRAMMFCSLG